MGRVEPELLSVPELTRREVVSALRDLRRRAEIWRRMAAFYEAASDDELGRRYSERARIYRECAADLEADLRDWADWLGLAAEYARGSC